MTTFSTFFFVTFFFLVAINLFGVYIINGIECDRMDWRFVSIEVLHGAN